MSVFDSLKVSLFGLSLVFIVLILLSFFVKFQSFILGAVAPGKKTVSGKDEAAFSQASEQEDIGLSSGELKLVGVDEKTAAMIMAIVSHESNIPLSGLQFKSIRVLD
jgi:Na+-transporting methylmalonyl-CoA/oxaloacetate decarboxylase gamma subunit